MDRTALAAILTATKDYDSLYLDDESYVDWSARTADGARIFEVGNAAGEAVQIDLSRADVEALVHRLAATLLADS